MSESLKLFDFFRWFPLKEKVDDKTQNYGTMLENYHFYGDTEKFGDNRLSQILNIIPFK